MNLISIQQSKIKIKKFLKKMCLCTKKFYPFKIRLLSGYIFFRIYFLVFNRKKFIQVWNNKEANKWQCVFWWPVPLSLVHLFATSHIIWGINGARQHLIIRAKGALSPRTLGRHRHVTCYINSHMWIENETGHAFWPSSRNSFHDFPCF